MMKTKHLLLAAAMASLAVSATAQQPVRVYPVRDDAPQARLAQESTPSPFASDDQVVRQYQGDVPVLLDPVPAPAEGELVITGCDCGMCGSAAPSCGCNEPSCGVGSMCCGGCGQMPGACCCGGGLDFPLVRGALNDVLPCDRCGCCEPQPWRLFSPMGRCCDWNLYGWLNGGGYSNAAGAQYNGPVTFADRDELQFYQAYAVLERQVNPARGEWDLGGRIDLLYGSDYIFTQAAGLETQPTGAPRWNSSAQYGLAMPQAYLDFGFNDDLHVKLGHFYTIIGYESVMAPQNFFLTHAYTMQYGEPFTHTGMLMSYDYSCSTTLHAGLVNGWDRFDGTSDQLAFLGGVNYAPGGNYDLAATLITGSEPDATGLQTSARTMYSLVANLQLTENFRYVLQHDHGWQQDYFGPQDAEWYGINQYLFYDLNSCWTIGGRFEWFRDDDGARVAGVRPGNPYPGGSAGDFHQATVGLNWRPTSNIVMRPEMRWDWFDGVGTAPFDNNTDNSQFAGGVDFILFW